MSYRSIFLATALVVTGSTSSFGLGVGFLENRGQLDPRVRFYAPLGSLTAYFTDDGVTFDVRKLPDRGMSRAPRDLALAVMPMQGHAVRLTFGETSHPGALSGEGRLATRYNYFLGASPDAWVTGVSAFERIVYREVRPGVDVSFFDANRGGLSFTITNGHTIQEFRWEGAPAEASLDGGVTIATAAGVIDAGANRIELRSPDAGSLGSGQHRDDPSALLFSSFLGGTSDEIGWSLALDHNDDVIVTGLTLSVAFPTTLGAYDTSYNQFGDVFITKLDAGGSNLVWGTFLGGTGANFDYGYAVALDADDRPIVTGYTWSADFPTTSGAYDRSHAGGVDVFAAKLSAGGDALVWSTFLGGSDHDIAYDLAVDATGDVVLSGRTLSFDFPIAGAAYDASHDLEEDAFVAKLLADGSDLSWSTYIGGSGYESADAVELDAAGQPIVGGYTASPDFPTTPGTHDPSWNGGLYDAYVLELEADGSDLVWCTYVGGSETDYGNGLALDSQGNPILVGETGSSDFPTTPGAYDTTFNGADDAYVTKLLGSSGSLLFGTFLGGSDPFYETAFGVAVDAEDRPVVVGTTPAFDFPTTPGAYDTSHNGGQDVFAARLSANGTMLLAGTFLGGAGTDYAWFAGIDSSGDVVLTGDTSSTDFPTTPGAFDTTYNGSDQDVWVAKLFLGTMAVGVEPATDAKAWLTAVPNPSRSSFEWQWSDGAVGVAEVEIFGAAGELVWRGTGEAPHALRWDGTDTSGRRVPAGTYLARATMRSGSVVTGRVAIVR